MDIPQTRLKNPHTHNRPLAVTALAKAYDLDCARFLLWIRDPVTHTPATMEDTPAGRELSLHGIEHEERAISLIAGDERVVEPEFPVGDLGTGTRATLELMASRAPYIGQAPLFLDDRMLPFPVHGLVDLLRLTRRSDDGVYQVVEIKSSRRIKASQMLQAAIYHRIMNHLSESDHCSAPRVIDGFFHEHPVPIEDFDPIVGEFLEITIPQWLDSGEDSFHRSFRCISCPFDVECKLNALHTGHPSLISGVTRGLARRLDALGAESPSQVDTLDPERLRSVAMEPGFIQRLRDQSDALKENRIRTVSNPSPLPAATVELFLDIEPDPTGPHPCRLGLLKRDRSINRSAYRGRIMPAVKDEGPVHINAYIDLLVRQIHRAVSESKSWLLLFYGGHVAESLFALGDISGIEHQVMDELFSHAVDMRALLRRVWFMPVERYSLSDILEACDLPPGVEYPGFVLHRRWRIAHDADRGGIEDSLIRHGERSCESLVMLWDWMNSPLVNGNDT